MSGLFRNREYLRAPSLRNSYDVVIIGGGAHGLAIAYYLAARHSVKNVAVLERAYIGSGGSGRNTTILRANYKMPESVALMNESLRMYRELSRELDYNLLLSKRGVFWLAHSEASLRVQRERALLNQALGVDTLFISAEEVKRLCPPIDLTCGGKNHPILGSSYHPPGSVIRHDAVVWGYAARASQLGVDVYQQTEATGFEIVDGRVKAVIAGGRRFTCESAVISAGGYASTVAGLAGVRLPIVTHPLQAFVTEPYRPVIDRIVASSDLLVYVSQTSRGELLVGAEIERYPSYSTRSTFPFLQEAASRAIDLLPFMSDLRILRAWTGVCDMTPDYSPLMGTTEIEGLYLNGGWGTWGFKAVPAAGAAMAELVATRRLPSLISPFRVDRFKDDRAIPDRSSAGTH